MTIWTPRLPKSGGAPIYQRIVEQLESDMGSGLLRDGSRLPTQRDLARRLGVTVVTVTRAYREAADRGLIESTVGRGSYVRAGRRDAASPAKEIDLGTNTISAGDLKISRELATRLEELLTPTYHIGSGSERHRAAGAAWIAPNRPDADASRIVVTSGGQQAILITLAALTKPGDTLMVEEVTYHGALAAANLLHLKLEPVTMDRFGILPEAFDAACRKKTARVLYVSPTVQNPTGTTLPDKRRRDVAAIAARHGVTIVEDDVYGFLATKPHLAITAHNRDGVFLTGLGKSLSPALRVGYVLAPEALLSRIQTALRATTLFTSPLGAEIAASAIEDGTAARVVAAKRHAIATRYGLASRILGKIGEPSPHLWLKMPLRWPAEVFAAEARRRGVRVALASSFAARTPAPQAIRISLGAPDTTAELEHGLQLIAALLERQPETEGAAIV